LEFELLLLSSFSMEFRIKSLKKFNLGNILKLSEKFKFRILAKDKVLNYDVLSSTFSLTYL